MKKHNALFDMMNINKNKKKEIENNNNIKKVICKSPSRGVYRDPKQNDNTFKKKESSELFYENKNTLHKNSTGINGNYKNNNNNNDKKGLKKKNKSVKNNFVVKTNKNKNLQKNNSINNFLRYENANKTNNLCNAKVLSKKYKSGDINNIHIVHKDKDKDNFIGKNNKSIYYSTARTNFYSFNSGKIK